jgi:hypothetical protein
MQSESEQVLHRGPTSSKYPRDDIYASVLEKAVTSALRQHPYFDVEGPNADERFDNGNICLVARWKHEKDHALQEQLESDADSVSSAAWYEDRLTLAGFAHPKEVGKRATQEDLEGVGISGAWYAAFAETLGEDPAVERSGQEGGPERSSLYCWGPALPDEVLQSLAELSGEHWARTAQDIIQPYFNRNCPEKATLPSSSEATSSQEG